MSSFIRIFDKVSEAWVQQAVNGRPGLFPNPFKDELWLQAEGNYTLRIYDVGGKLVKQATVAAGLMPLPQLSKGMYLIHLLDQQSQQLYSLKVLKE